MRCGFASAAPIAAGRRSPWCRGAGGQPLARTIERVGLRRPHLVLANVGSDDRFIIHAGGHGVNQAVMGERVAFLRDGAGEFALQVGHQLAPFLARLRLNMRVQLG